MPHHFNDRLNDLKVRVSRMGALVQELVQQSIDAVLGLDEGLARRVVESDERVDDEEVRVEKAALDLLALYQPAAVDLRLITTIIKVNSDLERIADSAVNIAQRVATLRQLERYQPPPDLRVMASSVVDILRDTIQAFARQDENLARQVLRSDDMVDALYHQIVTDMLTMLETKDQRATVDLANIMIAKNLERIGDHCTNIAEDVIYVCCGRIIRHSHAVE